MWLLLVPCTPTCSYMSRVSITVLVQYRWGPLERPSLCTVSVSRLTNPKYALVGYPRGSKWPRHRMLKFSSRRVNQTRSLSLSLSLELRRWPMLSAHGPSAGMLRRGSITAAEGACPATSVPAVIWKRAAPHNSLVSRLPAARYNPLGAINICNSRAACLLGREGWVVRVAAARQGLDSRR